MLRQVRWYTLLNIASLLLIASTMGCGDSSESSSKQKDFSKMDSSSDMFKAPPIVIAGDGLRGTMSLPEKQPDPLDLIPVLSLPDDLVLPNEPINLSHRPEMDESVQYEMLVIRELRDGDLAYQRQDLIETELRRKPSAGESGLNLEMATRRIRIGFETDPKRLAYDTTNPIIYSSNFATAVAGVLQATIDEPVRLVTDSLGTSIEVKFPSTLVQALGESPDANTFGTGDSYIREAACQCIVPLPTDAIEVGDTWESIASWSRFGPEITLTSTYRFEGLVNREGENCAVLSYETNTEGDASDSNRFNQLGYELQGVILVNAATGQLVELFNEANGSTELEMEEGPAKAFDLRFRTKLTRTDS